MADRTLTINHADGGSETYTINRDKFAGVRDMVIDGADVSVDHTAVPKEQSKETTFGGSQSITVNRDIEPLLSKVVGGAAAAYSLRDLNDSQGNNNVVRVRRESDNSEKDFKAKEVSNGTLTRWVNAQTIPPLDIGTEVNGVRVHVKDGGTSIGTPAAAYSLRNLSSSGTDVTTSGDTAGDTTGKYVVQVRRSSDDAVKSFTASEVADGTLEDWVNADVNTGPSSGVYAKLSGTGTISNATISSFDVDAGAVGLATNHTGYFAVEEGETVKVNATTTGDFTSGSILLVSGANFVSASLLSGTNDYELTAPADLPFADLRLNSVSSTTGFSFVINSIQIIKSNGYVRTWYDQSGNTNDATQTDPTKQPDIVVNGNLLEDGIDFDGSDEGMDISGLALASLNYGAFAVASIDNFDAPSLRTIFDSTDSSDAGFALSYGNTASKLTPFWFDGDDTTANIFSSGSNLTSSESLYSVIIKSGASTTHINGSLNETRTNTWATAGTNSFTKSTIGYDQVTPIHNFNGKLKELIIYETDQSDNRTVIEANIGETYGISGIPAANDTVNGYVQTWYDQSGNVPANDAVQNTAAYQPKIVVNGNLLEDGIDFDGVNDALSLANVFTGTDGVSTFIVGNADTTATSEPMFSQGNLNGTSGTAYSVSSEIAFRVAGSAVFNDDFIDANPLLLSLITPDAGTTTDAVARLNGTELSQTSSTGDTLNYTNQAAQIGKRFASTAAYDGSLKELIIYASDQSSNRPAIEANIANQYGITLS